MTGPAGPDEIGRLLGLKKLEVEGGRFRRTYLSEATVAGGRAASSAIVVLFSRDQPVSALHRLDGDEIWHLYLGGPMEMLLLSEDGAHEHLRLGPDLAAGERVQQLVPAGTWVGARLTREAEFALLGCTMTPAYRPEGFEPARRVGLLARYPAASQLISALTPDEDVEGAPPEV